MSFIKYPFCQNLASEEAIQMGIAEMGEANKNKKSLKKAGNPL
jgi:hypothetical protein